MIVEITYKNGGNFLLDLIVKKETLMLDVILEINKLSVFISFNFYAS